MSLWQDGISGFFRKFTSLIEKSSLFATDNFSRDQIKAGLFKFSEDTNWLMEGHDSFIQRERSNFFKEIPLDDNIGQDELFSIIEKHELLMRKKFPQTYPLNPGHDAVSIAYHKATYIAENIKKMSEAQIEDYAHKYDRMIGVYKKPELVIDNTPR
jgi:hypothetical protein